ncbi:Amidohydrolase 1 [Penicillium expansum]|nr:Amidohydrolase 1 [Penicillium expansum]
MDIAKYAKDDAWAMYPGLVENRETSLLGTLEMWEKWNGAADDRIRVWFGARTPGGVSDSLYKEMTAISKDKLASGICRVPDLQNAGVNIGLGTDGAPCNNTCDLLQEMKLAAIIHKGISQDPTVVPAENVLEMATINGAKALGLDKQIGSLEIGKKADFVAIDVRGIHTQPWFNPVSAVVYTATGRDVDVVVVNGKVLVKDGKLMTMDEEEIVQEAQRRSKEVVERAGLGDKVQGRWPVE